MGNGDWDDRIKTLETNQQVLERLVAELQSDVASLRGAVEAYHPGSDDKEEDK